MSHEVSQQLVGVKSVILAKFTTPIVINMPMTVLKPMQIHQGCFAEGFLNHVRLFKFSNRKPRKETEMDFCFS